MAGTNNASTTPTDFSYKYLIASLPSSSNRFELLGKTIVAMLLTGISVILVIRTATL